MTTTTTESLIAEDEADGCTYDDRFVAHGLTVDGMRGESSVTDSTQACGWLPANTFKCPNCDRRVCYCMGHGDCEMCDECCTGHPCEECDGAECVGHPLPF